MRSLDLNLRLSNLNIVLCVELCRVLAVLLDTNVANIMMQLFVLSSFINIFEAIPHLWDRRDHS